MQSRTSLRSKIGWSNTVFVFQTNYFSSFCYNSLADFSSQKKYILLPFLSTYSDEFRSSLRVRISSLPKHSLHLKILLDFPCFRSRAKIRAIAKMATSREEVEFKTLDGLTLRGVLFPAKKHSPAVILAPGVSYLHVAPSFSRYSLCLGDVLSESTNTF